MTERMNFITSIRGDYDDTLSFDEELRPKQGLFSMITEVIEDMVFEEPERPIGMTQLVRGTFMPASQAQSGVFFKHSPTFQDYPFLNTVESQSYGQAIRRS